MPGVEETRVHPETGKALVRGVRTITLTFRSQSETVDLARLVIRPTTPLRTTAIHDARDMQVSDRAINTMKAREIGVMSPGPVRSVRKKLRLSQRDAGRLIGGGPNAFPEI